MVNFLIKSVVAFFVLVSVANAQYETERVIGTLINPTTIKVGDMEITAKFRMNPKIVAEAINKDSYEFYGRVVINKKTRKISINVFDIRPDSRWTDRIEFYNGTYRIVRLADTYALFSTRFGNFKYPYSQISTPEGVDNMRQGKHNSLLSVILYYDEDLNEICIHSVNDMKEAKERIDFDVTPGATKVIFLKD